MARWHAAYLCSGAKQALQIHAEARQRPVLPGGRFFKDYLELKNSERQPFWNRFEIDLRGDTLFPHKKNEETGELEGTGDFFIIHRVWGDDVNLTSYSEADPTQKTEIPFKRVTSIPDPMENSAPPLPTN